MKNRINFIVLACCLLVLLPIISIGQEISNEEEYNEHGHQTAGIHSTDINVIRAMRNVSQSKSTKHDFFSNKNQLSYTTSFLRDGRFSRPGNFLMSQFQYSRIIQLDSANWFVKVGLGFYPVITTYNTTNFSGINFSVPISIGYAFNRFQVAIEYVPYMVARFGRDKKLAKERRSCLQFDDYPYPSECFNADTWLLPFEDDHFAFLKIGYTGLNGFGIEIGAGMGRIYGHAFVLQKVTQFASRIQLNYNF